MVPLSSVSPPVRRSAWAKADALPPKAGGESEDSNSTSLLPRHCSQFSSHPTGTRTLNRILNRHPYSDTLNRFTSSISACLSTTKQFDCIAMRSIAGRFD